MLNEKIAVITGAASGIGRASVISFLNHGACVVAADINVKAGTDLMTEVKKLGCGDRFRFQRCDVAEEADVRTSIRLARQEFGGLDCLFNNAGVGGAFGAVTDLSMADWDKTFAILTRSVFLGIKHAAKEMIDLGSGGTIINTASIAGLSAGAGSMAYSAAKAAVINITQSAAVSLAEHKIRVNAISPGIILTPLIHRGHREKLSEQLFAAQPWPEPGLPEHVADLATFLASDMSRFITGESITIDGGLTASGPALFTGHNPIGKLINSCITDGLGREQTDTAGSGGSAGFDQGTSDT